MGVADKKPLHFPVLGQGEFPSARARAPDQVREMESQELAAAQGEAAAQEEAASQEGEVSLKPYFYNLGEGYLPIYFQSKISWYPIANTATSQMAWDIQQTHIDLWRMYSHDQIAAAEIKPKHAIPVCHHSNPNR